MKVIPIAIRAPGTVPEESEKGLQEVEIRGRIVAILTTTRTHKAQNRMIDNKPSIH